MTYEERVATIFPFAYRDNAGNSCTIDVSGQDMMDSVSFIDKLRSVSVVDSALSIPSAFVKMFQQFCVDVLGISSEDDSEPNTSYDVSHMNFFSVNGYYVPAGKTYSNYNSLNNGKGYYYSDSPFWIMDVKQPTGIHDLSIVAPVTATIYHHYEQKTTQPYPITFNNPEASTGYSYSSSISDVLLEKITSPINLTLDTVVPYSLIENGILTSSVSYARTPSIDTEYTKAGVGALTWQGTADVATTVGNQNAAVDVDEYLKGVISIPIDVPLPSESETTDETESEGTDTGDAALKTTLATILARIEALPVSIAEALGDKFSKDEEENFDGEKMKLPVSIADKFPFCIPFDLAYLVGVLNAEPETPVLELPLEFHYLGFDYSQVFVVDFSFWDDVVVVLRILEDILFCAGLIVVTRHLIRG